MDERTKAQKQIRIMKVANITENSKRQEAVERQDRLRPEEKCHIKSRRTYLTNLSKQMKEQLPQKQIRVIKVTSIAESSKTKERMLWRDMISYTLKRNCT